LNPLRCPICKSEITAESKAFPFCGERCRLLDLGNWLDGRYTLNDDAEAEEPQKK